MYSMFMYIHVHKENKITYLHTFIYWTSNIKLKVSTKKKWWPQLHTLWRGRTKIALSIHFYNLWFLFSSFLITYSISLIRRCIADQVMIKTYMFLNILKMFIQQLWCVRSCIRHRRIKMTIPVIKEHRACWKKLTGNHDLELKLEWLSKKEKKN